ncbi:MAG: hypothetical protein K0R18_288 [Bacillales bacterium]|jgi:hypothetical protein|nr:hypothetical protein [Bacillales bacterium]
MDTKEIAVDLLLGNLDVADLIEDVRFLGEVDKSLLQLSEDHETWSGVLVARKRHQLMDRIAMVLNEGEIKDVASLQRTNRSKR